MKDHEIAQPMSAGCYTLRADHGDWLDVRDPQGYRNTINQPGAIALIRQQARELAELREAQTRLPTDAECERIANEYYRTKGPPNCDMAVFWYGLCMFEAVRKVMGAPLQQNYSGITADGQNTSQVVDFGAAGPNRTGDLLITNQNKDTPETPHNQDVTPKTAPAWPAQVVPTESSGCEGVTAALDDIRVAIQDASRLIVAAADTYPQLGAIARDSLRKAYGRTYAIARVFEDHSTGAPWLTLAHDLCTDAGVPQGHIADRLEALRKVLESRE